MGLINLLGANEGIGFGPMFKTRSCPFPLEVAALLFMYTLVRYLVELLKNKI